MNKEENKKDLFSPALKEIQEINKIKDDFLMDVIRKQQEVMRGVDRVHSVARHERDELMKDWHRKAWGADEDGIAEAKRLYIDELNKINIEMIEKINYEVMMFMNMSEFVYKVCGSYKIKNDDEKVELTDGSFEKEYDEKLEEMKKGKK